MPDIVLYSVPTDGANDVRLRNPESIPGAITGTLAAIEGQDVATLAGVLEYSGTLAAVEGQDVAAFDGTVSAPAITGTFAAVEARDVASFDGTVAGSQSLTGRRVRGKRVIYPDELPPIGLEAEIAKKAPKVELAPLLPELPVAKADTAKAAKLLKQAKAERDAHAAHIARLRDEDEFWLLAA